MALFDVDLDELNRFVDWLPELRWSEAYTVMLLIRSKLLKKLYGFKGTDHTLALKIVPGYLVMFKERLRRVILRLAVWRRYSDVLFEYVRYKPGTREPEEVIAVPNALVGVMIGINPCDWVKCAEEACHEFHNSLVEAMYNPGNADKLVRRPDLRLPALCMKRARRRFHQIDLDTTDKDVVKDFNEKLVDVLGFLPARIRTPHGWHYLVPVSRFDKETARRWFGEFLPKLEQIKQIYADRLGIRDEEVDKLVEWKKDFQEPVPGIPYQGGFIPRFYPEER